MLKFLAKLVVHDPYRIESVWQSFLLTKDENDNPVCEWWNDERKVTLYIGSLSSEDYHNMVYVKTDGDDISEPEDGKLTSFSDFVKVWRWLHYNGPGSDNLSDD